MAVNPASRFKPLRISPPLLIVILRESGVSSIPEPSRLIMECSGILGRPVEPGDDSRYFRRTAL
jgi:hypothetical protein